MADAGSLKKRKKQLESAEANTISRDIVVLDELRRLVERGRQLAQRAQNYQIVESFRVLQQIGQLLPNLEQDLRDETMEQRGIEQAEQQVEAEERQEGQIISREKQEDVQEIAILRDALNRLTIMDSKFRRNVDNNIISAALRDIATIQADLSKIAQLERDEFNKEMQRRMLEGVTDKEMVNLIRSETSLLNFLRKLIEEIRDLIQQFADNKKIRAYIGKSVVIVKRLINLNRAEMSR